MDPTEVTERMKKIDKADIANMHVNPGEIRACVVYDYTLNAPINFESFRNALNIISQNQIPDSIRIDINGDNEHIMMTISHKNTHSRSSINIVKSTVSIAEYTIVMTPITYYLAPCYESEEPVGKGR